MVGPHPVRIVSLVTLLAAATLAGCLSDTENDDTLAVTVAPFVDPMAYDADHDHGDYAQHELSWNMLELGWGQVVDGAAVAWGELDILGDMAVVAHAWPTAGVATVDVSDPANPALLDHLDLGYGYGADVKWAPDGAHAVLAIQAHSSRGLQAPLPDPLAMTAESGLMLLHIDTDGTITEDHWLPAPTGGSHMVATATIAQRDYAFAVHNGYGILVYEIALLDDHRLLPVTHWRHFDGPLGAVDVTGPHDMTILHDETLDRPLLYVSDAYKGLVVADVSDPRQPTYLGGWDDPETEWYAHTAQAEVLEDGTRLIVVVPEVFSDAEAEVVAPLWVLDGTDLGNIELEATWKNPGDHGAEQLRYSVHNFQLVNGMVFLAHYHGGIWVLDVSVDDTNEANTTITPVGYYLPHHDPGRPMSGIYHGVYNMEDAPTVWDVVVKDGVIWATDVNSGLYALAHPDIPVGDDTWTSRG